MNKEYKRDGMNNYLVFQKEENASSLEMNMMINNQIEGVIPLEIRSLNGQEYLYYEINSKQSLQRLLQLVELKKEDLRKLFLDMIEILEEGRNYLLQLNHFYLSPETIFLDVSNRKLSLCFVPGYDNNVMKQIEGVIEYFMNHINHQNQEVVVFIYGLYRLSKQDNFTLQDLKNGKHTEVDMFAGTVVRLGKELGVETPICEMFYHGLRLVEARLFGEV